MDNSFNDQELVAVLRDLVLAVKHPHVDDAPWVDWSPIFIGHGSMTVFSPTVYAARYKLIGRTVHFSLDAGLSLGGTKTDRINFTLPLKPISEGFVFSANLTKTSDPARYGAYAYMTNSSSNVSLAIIKFSDSSNFAADFTFMTVTGTYEIE